MTVFCDNYECIFIDECGFCDCDKLSIVSGVCERSYHSGRNAADAELDHIEDKSRWHELFGTPERAARTLSPDDMSCKWCLLHDYCKDECLIEEHDRLLEWLRGDAEYAEGGTVSENYIDFGENGSICPIPRANVIFEGQKLTFDDEDSAKFAELVKGHFRKLAGLRGDAE